jgi:hypothetical protein
MRKARLGSTYSFRFHVLDEGFGGLGVAVVSEPGAPTEDADGRVWEQVSDEYLLGSGDEDLLLTGDFSATHGLRNDVLRLALFAKHCTDNGRNNVVCALDRLLDQVFNGCSSLVSHIHGLTGTTVSKRSIAISSPKLLTAAARVRQ